MQFPLGVAEHKFKKWQEAMRKCIERVFDAIQITFQCLQNPCRKHNLKDIEGGSLPATVDSIQS